VHPIVQLYVAHHCFRLVHEVILNTEQCILLQFSPVCKPPYLDDTHERHEHIHDTHETHTKHSLISQSQLGTSWALPGTATSPQPPHPHPHLHLVSKWQWFPEIFVSVSASELTPSVLLRQTEAEVRSRFSILSKPCALKRSLVIDVLDPS
jgi:hypothetical protein